MSAADLGDLTVIDTTTGQEAVTRLAAILGMEGPQLVVVKTAARDTIPRPLRVVPGGGPDLKRVAADDGGEPAIAAMTRLLASRGRPDVTILGPGAGAPQMNETGTTLVLSALGPAATRRVGALPDIGLHLDVGVDAFESLDTLALSLFQRTADAPRWRRVVLLGLTPSNATRDAIVAFGRRATVIAWDPDAARVAAWQSHGIAATTHWPAVTAVFGPPLPPSPVLISTSEALADLAARALGVAPESELPEAAVEALASDLPSHVALTSPLVVPEAPARPGLPPGHRRQIAAAIAHLQAVGLGALVVVSAEDPALADLKAELEGASHAVCMAVDDLAPFAESRRLIATAAALEARTPRLEPGSGVDPRVLEGLQTRLVASLVMRQRDLVGREALSIATILTGSAALPRVTATSLGHVAAIAARAGGPVVVGLEPTGRMRGPVGAVPAAIRCETVGDAESAFDALIADPASPLAYEPRFVATLPEGARHAEIRVTRQPIASLFAVETTDGSIQGYLGEHADGTLPPFVRAVLERIAALWDVVDAIGTLTLWVVGSAGAATPSLIDARIGLVGRGPAALQHLGRRFD